MSKKFILGEQIILDYTAVNGTEDLFLHALLIDASNAPVGNAIVMPHIGNGLYRGLTTMPDTSKLTAIYIPFDDEPRTQENDEIGRDIECFHRDLTRPLLENINTNINSLISQGLPGDIIEGLIDDDSDILIGLIEC